MLGHKKNLLQGGGLLDELGSHLLVGQLRAGRAVLLAQRVRDDLRIAQILVSNGVRLVGSVAGAALFGLGAADISGNVGWRGAL
jgi:hypothetical protein